MQRPCLQWSALLLGLPLIPWTIACSSSSDSVPPQVNAWELPLLPAGRHVGIIYSQPSSAAQATLDAAFSECIARGADSYELSMAWTDIETSPGVYDTGYFDNLLALTQAAGLLPYLVIKTIDTVTLNLPPDLVDAADSSELAQGLTWNDPSLLSRFEAVLDLVVPRLVQAGGFYLSVGNEVDGYLSARPAAQSDFVAFVAHSRSHVHASEERLAVGATLTFSALGNTPQLVSDLRSASDLLAWTYYPLNPDFTPQSPSVVSADIAAMRNAVAPRALLLQEVGYPAGWTGAPTNGSSHEKQRAFVENLFVEMGLDPEIRFMSLLQLADWSAAELDVFEDYYGLSDPMFREYLGTLGLRENADGATKPSYAEFLLGLDGL